MVFRLLLVFPLSLGTVRLSRSHSAFFHIMNLKSSVTDWAIVETLSLSCLEIWLIGVLLPKCLIVVYRWVETQTILDLVWSFEVWKLICLQIVLLDDIALLHVNKWGLPFLLLELVDFFEVKVLSASVL